jgi:hypothetical protein
MSVKIEYHDLSVCTFLVSALRNPVPYWFIWTLEHFHESAELMDTIIIKVREAKVAA